MMDEKKSLAEIGRIVGMDWRKVKRILGRPKTKTYHPNTLTDNAKWPDIKSRIEEMYRDNSKLFTHQVIDSIEKTFGEKVGKNCVARIRKEMGLVRKKVRYGFMVRVPNRQKRVDWAKEMIDKKEMFLNIFFADEASVLLDNGGFVWVDSKDPYAHIAPKPKHQYRVMIWCAISMMGAAEIKIMGPTERLKSEDYVEVIQEYYIPASKKLYGKNSRLIHDNAPIHVSKHTKKRLLELGVKVNRWPAESPDMMPVELVFAYMKVRLRHFYKLTNKDELIEAILKFKEEHLTKEYCRKLIRRLHETMPQVIRREGLPVRGKKD